MAFKGTLKEFKVPDILQLFSFQKKTGILTFTSSEGFITLIFEDGMIVGVDAFPKKLGLRVGSVLCKQDLISEEMLQRALSIQKRTNQKIGEVLTGMGLIGKDQVAEALKNQAVQIVLSLFKWKKGEYNFKVMERLDESLRGIKPMATDNLIMEGVQMLDEWPLIKKVVPNNRLVFTPAPIESNDIEIISEYDDEPVRNGMIYLSDSEASILKYINGNNSVQDLVDLGVFTEYKVYKSLYKLVNKRVIKPKEDVGDTDSIDDMLLEKRKESAVKKGSALFYLVIALLLILVVLTFSNPFKPFVDDKVMDFSPRTETRKTTKTNIKN